MSYRRIQDFTPPPGVPADFVGQVREIVLRYNGCVNELLASQKKLRELQTQLKEEKEARVSLQTRYTQLEDMARQVADDYELVMQRLAADRPVVQTQPPILRVEEPDEDDQELSRLMDAAPVPTPTLASASVAVPTVQEPLEADTL